VKGLPTYKHGKQTETIDFDSFKQVIEHGKFVQANRDQSFLAFLFWFGVRVSEAYDRVKEDFVIIGENLVVNCPAKKKGKRWILQAPVSLPFIDLVLKQVDITKKGRKVWNFKEITAWRIVKRAMGEKYYPHFFRLNRAVHFLDDPTTTIPEMQSWFGWRGINTINSYLGYSKRHLDKQSERLKKDVMK
jgi:hypothetical protein